MKKYPKNIKSISNLILKYISKKRPGDFNQSVMDLGSEICKSKKPKCNIYVLGAGKAAGSMAKAFEDECPFELEGFVITRYDHFVKTKKIKVVEASHPIPDLNGYNATKKIIQIAKNTSKDDLVIFLISGGASALLCSPLDGCLL